jgi:cytochrome c oxidase cbb3-type subunit 1
MVFLAGVLVMVFNIYMTIRQGKREAAELEAKLAAKLARAAA